MAQKSNFMNQQDLFHVDIGFYVYFSHFYFEYESQILHHW